MPASQDNQLSPNRNKARYTPKQSLVGLLLKSLAGLVVSVVMFVNIIYWWLNGEGNWFNTLYGSCIGLGFGWVCFVHARQVVKRFRSKSLDPL